MTLLEERPSGQYRESCIPVLETRRLVLRAPRIEDVKTIAVLANDQRIAEKTRRIPHPYEVRDAERFIGEAHRAGEIAFLITLQDQAIIGACGITMVHEQPELGYWLGVPFWGNGYATEAAHAVIDYAFTEFGYDALNAGARVVNPASRRVLEKCGFQWTGVGLYRISAINSSAPIDRFRLERRIWHALKEWGRVKNG